MKDIWDSEIIKNDREILRKCTNYCTQERIDAEKRDRQRAIDDINAGRIDPDGLDG